MTRQIQIRRGTADEHTNFTGAVGEITMDTTNKTIRVHDGETSGGVPLAKQSEIPAPYTMPENYDFVVETQAPTAENNYTWYRKYKSGWVEQGGITSEVTISAGWSNSDNIIVFPITMTNTNYTITVGLVNGDFGTATISKTTTGCTITLYNRAANGNGQYKATWHLCGFAA